MRTLFITIAGPERDIDLEVPGQVQPAELIPELLEIFGLTSVHGLPATSLWEIKSAGAQFPLDPFRSLIDSGVANAAVLALRNRSQADLEEERRAFPEPELQVSTPDRLFYRPVRNYPEQLPRAEFQIQAPPREPQRQGGSSSLIQLLYPLSGLLITVVMVMITTTSGAHLSPFIIGLEISIVPTSLVLMFLLTYLMSRSTRAAHKAEKQAYRSYLENVERRLSGIVKLQSLYNERLYPDPRLLPTLVAQHRVLWERRPADNDFLFVRVGLAPDALCCQVTFQEDFKVKYTQDLLQQARNLVTRYSYVDNQPLAIPLGRLGTIAVTGVRPAVTALVRSMLAEILAFHAPSEVRIVGYFPSQSASEWSWLKWAPHTRLLHPIKTLQPADPELYCMLADNLDNLQLILETQIEPELERRYMSKKKEPTFDENNTAPRDIRIPHIIVVLDGFSHSASLAHIPGLEEVMRNGDRFGMTVLCLCSTQEQEPSLTRARLSLAPFIDGYLLSYKEIISDKETISDDREFEFIRADDLDAQHCEKVARNLASLRVIDFPQNISLLELYNIPSLENLDVRQLWRKAEEKQLLRAPIGIQMDGPFLLDLKEMALGGYGPHGLVVGATGAGKSELLRTVVTSLALTHDPATLNFVLVDIISSAAFADFEHLPHLAGMITDLEDDPQFINRMYASLSGEQQRRQSMLSRAGNLSNIRQYQAKWLKNPEMEPMPYLLIIVDEFTHLIALDPAFLEIFVKLGQVGRSLGMHMMLAAQQFDEGRLRGLESHLRYRIGLRTFSQGESVALIGKPDAYLLPSAPGRGYLKVDEDIYTGFKTALISAPDVTMEKEAENPLDLVREFTSTGRLLSRRVPVRRLAKETEEDGIASRKNAIVEHIAQVPEPPGGWRVHKIWQPALGRQIPLVSILKKCNLDELDGSAWPEHYPLGHLCVPLGLMDLPAEQVQVPMVLDFSGAGGHLAIAGSPQSGKTTLLCTLITSLILTHTPRDIQIYAIDSGRSPLHVFENVPHIGAICKRGDENKISSMLRRLKQLLVERAALFMAHEVGNMVAYRQLLQQGKLDPQEFGDVFLIVDDFGRLPANFEASDTDIINDIEHLITNGLTYGVHVVLTANLWSEIRPHLRASIGLRLELRLKDPADSEIDRRLSSTLSLSGPGRGLHPDRLIFQVALPAVRDEKKDVSSTQHSLESLVQRTASSWKGPGAPRIATLPGEVRIEDVLTLADQTIPGVPIGLEEFRLEPQYIDLTDTYPHFLVFGSIGCGKTNVLRTWMRGIEKCYSTDQAQFAIVDYRRSLLDLAESTHIFAYLYTPLALKEGVERLKAEARRRFLIKPVHNRHWQGPHFFLFVDNYEIILASKENPLGELFEYILHMPDVGFHFILTCNIEKVEIHTDPIIKLLRNQGNSGLIMSGNSKTSPLLGQQKFSSLPPGRGYLVRKEKPSTLIQVAYTGVSTFFREAEDPYIVGRPVRGASFVGRRDVLKMIQDNLKPSAGNNVLVLRGQRRTGKTSVLLRVCETLAEESQGAYLPVFVDLESMSGIENEGQFFYLLADQIREDLALHDVALPSRSAFEEAPTITFRLQFLKPLTEALGSRRVLLMLDEFQMLQEFIEKGRVSSEVLRFCRYLMQHTFLLFLIAGTHKLRELTGDYWSVFFNLAVPIDIGILNAAEAEWLITEPVRRWYTLEPLAVREIVRIAGCHPYFTQLICKKLLEVRNEVKVSNMTIRDVEKAVDLALKSGYEQIGYPWTEGDCSASERLVLSVLAVNGTSAAINTIQQQLIRNGLDIKVSRALNRLQERGIVRRDDEERVSFVVPLLRSWIIRERYDDLRRTMQYNAEHQAPDI